MNIQQDLVDEMLGKTNSNVDITINVEAIYNHPEGNQLTAETYKKMALQKVNKK